METVDPTSHAPSQRVVHCHADAHWCWGICLMALWRACAANRPCVHGAGDLPYPSRFDGWERFARSTRYDSKACRSGAAMTTARRSLMFATVIVACAGSGFIASRLWPLPASINPGLKVASADPTGFKKPDEPRRSIDVRSPARPRDDGQPLTPQHEATDATERPVHAALVLLNPHTAEQSRERDEAIELPTVKGPAPEAARPTRAVRQSQEKRPPTHQAVPRRERPSAETRPSQPSTKATSPQRDAALRDFMSHNPPFRP
jgi:hypothetical protein